MATECVCLEKGSLHSVGLIVINKNDKIYNPLVLMRLFPFFIHLPMSLYVVAFNVFFHQ